MERLNSFTAICKEVKVNFIITDVIHAEKELDVHLPCALVCSTDIYAIKLLRVAQKYSSGIIGFDNLRLIDELELQLDSVYYDIKLTAKTAVDYIINRLPIVDIIPHKIVKRGSV